MIKSHITNENRQYGQYKNKINVKLQNKNFKT